MDKFKLMHCFLTVVDHGSYSQAARVLALSPSTVSKAISRLERMIDIHLFQRSTRQLRLTCEGKQYALKIRPLLEQLESCETNIKQHCKIPSGQLRVTVPVSYGRLYIQPLLKSFGQLYPEISIELCYDDKHVDIIEQGFDVCIRSGTLVDSRLVVRQLSPIDFLICASPAYLTNYNAPKTIEEFPQHRWIRFRFQQSGQLLPIMMPESMAIVESEQDQTYIVNDGEAMAELCADGVGLTQAPHFIVRNLLKEQRIVSLFPSFHPKGFGVYLLYLKQENLPERVKVFVDFIVKQVELLGETPQKTWARSIKSWSSAPM